MSPLTSAVSTPGTPALIHFSSADGVSTAFAADAPCASAASGSARPAASRTTLVGFLMVRSCRCGSGNRLEPVVSLRLLLGHRRPAGDARRPRDPLARMHQPAQALGARDRAGHRALRRELLAVLDERVLARRARRRVG